MSQPRSKKLQVILDAQAELLEKVSEIVHLREQRVEMAAGYAERFGIFLEKRDEAEVNAAKVFIKNLFGSQDLPAWCNTGFRALLHVALKARVDLSPTIQFKDFELFAVWGLLILEVELDHLKKIIIGNDFDKHLHTVEAQLSETLQLTMKLNMQSFILDAASEKVNELTLFGASIGVSGNSRNAGKQSQLPRAKLQERVVEKYVEGLHGYPFGDADESPWASPADAGRRIYDKLSPPLRELTKSNGAKKMTRWIWKWIHDQEKSGKLTV